MEGAICQPAEPTVGQDVANSVELDNMAVNPISGRHGLQSSYVIFMWRKLLPGLPHVEVRQEDRRISSSIWDPCQKVSDSIAFSKRASDETDCA